MDGPNAEILVEEGVERGRVVPLRPGKVLELGRECSFRLEDPALSRRHARIAWDGRAYVIEDHGSTWGTFINGTRIRTHALRHGDRIRVGAHTLLFTILQEAPTPVPGEMPTPRAPLSAGDAGPGPSDGGAPEQETAPAPGFCANCGKPADGPGTPHPVDRVPRSYCRSCAQQYPVLGRVLANHFCERVLGAGGMGVVYRGVHVVMGRIAALKTLRVMDGADPTLVQRLLREATAGGRIQHPNIVSVHDTGEQDNVAYVVMEYVSGENLAEALRREQRFPVPRALRFAVQVADALAAGFRLGYIHRDIKPENILLTRGDVVKVTDFGLAKNLKETELGGLTKTGQVLGTMLYMPPEQIVSSKGSDQRADIYSLGATLYHLLAGRPPFDSRSAIMLLMDIRTKEPPPLASLVPGLPPAVDHVVSRCLRKDPAERYQTPEELAADLRAASRA